MATRDVIVALDLGTTGNRAIAFAHDGSVVAQAYRTLTQHYPQPGWVEHDPVELCRTALDALTEVVGAVGAASVRAIGIANQRETSVVWDRATGKPLCNAIVWQDRRTAGMCEALSGARGFVKAKTGLFIDPYFSATKIRWVLDKTDPDHARAKSGALAFGTPDTWVLWNLTKGRAHSTDPSNASRTMLFDIAALSWDAELLDLFGIPQEILPEVRDSDALAGYTDTALFGHPIPIAGMLGDQQAALFGQRGWDSDTVKATYGTGIFILVNTGEAVVSSDKLVSTVAWKTRQGVRYALEGSLFMGGASVQWLEENLGIIAGPAETAEAALRAGSNDGVYFVPAFQGLGSPYWAPDARALLIGLTRKANRDTVIRAALESMAYQVRDVVEEFTRSMGRPVKTLRVDGGATHNDFLMQFQADMLGISVVRARATETTALGVAGMAGISCGFWDEASFAEVLGADRTFGPAGDPKTQDRLYAGWQEAVRRSLGWARVVQ
jgi:glycerol kinase